MHLNGGYSTGADWAVGGLWLCSLASCIIISRADRSCMSPCNKNKPMKLWCKIMECM